MKHILFVSGLILASLFAAGQEHLIPIQTRDHVILLSTDRENRLRTIYFGEILKDPAEYEAIARAKQFFDPNAGTFNGAYTPAGTWNLSEPAIQVVHADGNRSLDLHYVRHATEKDGKGGSLTRIWLEDPVYPFRVTLFYKVWEDENVIEQWTEIEHSENGPVLMEKYASANLYFDAASFYLTTFHNYWANEMKPVEMRLEKGIRSVDSKLGTRANLLQSPCFILSFDEPRSEDQGSVILGQLAWSGNFKMEFEVDAFDKLRFIAGVNPYASAYRLEPEQVFKTPSLVYAVSLHGTGEASRGLHNWARKYRVLDGEGERLTLLNNWEATYFSFDEDKITSLFKGARELGVDLFLLDDGWFGNKYPRDSDGAGLGDWQENQKKLPHGVPYLIEKAKEEGLKFGIWIEPEMVNPKSELYEAHPDWVIRQPERPEIYFRNQLVLDLSNPEVQDFVFGVVDHLFSENPDLAFIKWDCNAPVFNAHSVYLESTGKPQSHLYMEYVHGLYKVLERVRAKYPEVPMMLCSGGGGRADYELLKFFTEFWPSDNTDPLERVFMQWNYSYFFPSISTDCHVTNWGEQSLKYKVDVASMGKLGFDIVAGELSPEEMQFCKEAIGNYNSFKEVVWHGDQYRLMDPHLGDMASLMYVNRDQSRAILFSYQVNTRLIMPATGTQVKLKGLDPESYYSIRELNQFPGSEPSRIDPEQLYSGDFLMKVGINPGVGQRNPSVVLEIRKVVR